MIFLYDYRKSCAVAKKNLLALIVFVVVLGFCLLLVQLWLLVFPFIEAETAWGDLYNLFP